MDFGALKTIIILFLIKNSICDKGFVNEVFLNKRFYCAHGSNETSTVTSQIQCIHRCLRKKCELLNYNVNQGMKDNCEVFTLTIDCAIMTNQENWMAVGFQGTL